MADSVATSSPTPTPDPTPPPDPTPMVQLEIHKGASAELVAGGLRFVACRREVGGIDGGISLYIFSALPDEERELLRFDLFRTRPHYHAPAEDQNETRIDPAPHADSSGWGVEALTTRAGEFVAQAGFSEIADQLDADALLQAAPELEAMFSGLAEPTERSTFEIPQSVLDSLTAD